MTYDELSAAPDVPVATALARLAREGRPGHFDAGLYTLRYALWGSGPPLVFVHGLSDVARSFALVAADLSRDFTCILYELPSGDGDAARLGAYRHRHYADDLHRLLDHLKLDRTYLLGSSFGSTIAQRAAADRPERFARLVLQGGFARRPVHPRDVVLARFARYWRGRMRSMPVKTSLKNPKEASVFATVPDDRRRFFEDNVGSALIGATARIGLLIAGLDTRPLLPKLTMPVRLIGGDRDGIIAPEREQELLAGLPNAERVEIPQCGHVPQYTHPGLLAELTRVFLNPNCQATCTHPHTDAVAPPAAAS
ncbi:MAG: alpha/beta hydrolase [Gemmataceae bacterium]|nr:alpha/beta hydrolase [Gemmataceae bacterium]